MELAPFGEIVGRRPGVLRAVRVQMELAPFCYVHRVFGHFLAGQGYANRGGMSGFSDAEWEAMRQRAEELRREKRADQLRHPRTQRRYPGAHSRAHSPRRSLNTCAAGGADDAYPAHECEPAHAYDRRIHRKVCERDGA